MSERPKLPIWNRGWTVTVITVPRALLLLALSPLLLAGCLTAASTGYEAARDERTLGVQTADAKIATTIRKRLTDTQTTALASLDVFCHQGLVVIAGVVPPDSTLGARAVEIARGVEGVRRVETYYVPSQPSKRSDFTISAKIKAKLVGDGQVKSTQVDWSVLGGHVVVVGVMESAAKVEQVLRHVRSVDGVAVVKSFVQVKPPEKP